MVSTLALRSCRPTVASSLQHRPPQPCRRPVTLHVAPRPYSGTLQRAVAARASLADVAKYLSEAAARMLHLQQESDVNWEGTSSAFTGKITHHEAPARLRALYKQVEAAKQELNVQLASADDDGEEDTVYKFDKDGKPVPAPGTAGDFVTTAIQRVFGHNFKGDESEPKTWMSTGYTSSHRRSRRSIQREVDYLTRFEGVVKKAMDQAELASKVTAGAAAQSAAPASGKKRLSDDAVMNRDM